MPMPPNLSRATSSGRPSTTPFRPPGPARPTTSATTSATQSSDDEFGIGASLLEDDLESLAPLADQSRPARPAAQESTSIVSRPAPARQSLLEDREPCIPGPLLTRIMHEAFKHADTGISRAGQEAMARYVDVFVREAVARAAEEQRLKNGGKVEVGGTWVDAGDLEAVVPGLLMDF